MRSRRASPEKAVQAEPTWQLSAAVGEQSMEVTLSEVVSAASQRLAPLTAEVAGYLVLLVCEGLGLAPHRVGTRDIAVTGAGGIAVVGGEAAPSYEVELDLRQLLAQLLSLCQSTTPALKKASARAASGDLSALHAELVAALIPINHAASRRALARLCRETARARSGTSLSRLLAEPTPAVASVSAAPASLEAGPPASAYAEATAAPPRFECEPLGPSAAVTPAIDVPADFVWLAADSDAPAAAPELFESSESEQWDLDIEPSAAFAPEPEGSFEELLVPALDVECPFQHESQPSEAITLEAAVCEPGAGASDEALEIDVQFLAEDTLSEDKGREGNAASAGAVPQQAPRAAAHKTSTSPFRRTQPGLAPAGWLPSFLASAGLASAGKLTPELGLASAPEHSESRGGAPAAERLASDTPDRHRSDLSQLLAKFLAESASDERITRDLRRMMGLVLDGERGADKDTRAAGG